MRISTLVMLSSIVLSVGCQATHLVYVQDTVLGIGLQATSEGKQKFSLGFDRDTYAIVPRTQDGADAMAVTSATEIRAKGISKLQYDNFVSTGLAAKALAEEAEGFAQITELIHGEGTDDKD